MNTTEDELSALAGRAQRGDQQALEELLSAVRPLVMKRCAKFLPYNGDAEDAAQEALVTIAQKLDTWTGKGTFTGWVTVVASNCARATYRTLKRRFAESAHETVPESLDPRTTSVIAGTRIDLMEALEALERARPATVDAFVMRDLGSLPYEEIAVATDTPLGTVKTRIRDAREFMRSMLIERLES